MRLASGRCSVTRVRRVLTWTTAGVLVLYVCAAAALYGFQRRLIFPGQMVDVRDASRPDVAGLEVIDVPTSAGTTEAWYLPPLTGDQPAPALIFAHGNGEVIDWWAAGLDEFRRRGMAVLLVEYPGYGRSAGSPSEVSIAEAMTRAYDRLVERPEIDRRRIVGYGQSLGGGAVGALSRQRPLAAMVLQSTFTDLRRFATRFWMPGWLVRDPFDNLAAVAGFAGPVLVVHGRGDELIPAAQGEELAQAAGDGTLRLHDCGHGCWGPAVVADIRWFLQQHRILPPGA